MRFLFVKEMLAWPRSSGHDVHCYHMMRALAELGHEVSLLTRTSPNPESLAGVELARQQVFPPGDGTNANGRPLRLSNLQERFRSYWGIRTADIKAVGRVAEECRSDVVAVVGLNVLPYLAAVEHACRVWYAADEWAWHHLSQVRPGDGSLWENVRNAVIKGLYERAYGPLLQRIWVVTEADRRAMRCVTGRKAIDVIPNGVDGSYYRPMEQAQENATCTFWGRLDFGPNIQALEWFCHRVWPHVRHKVPNARFTIYGFQPTPAVTRLAGQEGIALIPDLPDLRSEIGRHQVVVLPFVSGGGIKNKLLEAASMGKAILCTPHACGGLRLGQARPFLLARNSGQWADILGRLWSNHALRQDLGRQARNWVVTHHSWRAAAQAALAGLEPMVRENHP